MSSSTGAKRGRGEWAMSGWAAGRTRRGIQALAIAASPDECVLYRRTLASGGDRVRAGRGGGAAVLQYRLRFIRLKGILSERQEEGG